MKNNSNNWDRILWTWCVDERRTFRLYQGMLRLWSGKNVFNYLFATKFYLNISLSLFPPLQTSHESHQPTNFPTEPLEAMGAHFSWLPGRKHQRMRWFLFVFVFSTISTRRQVYSMSFYSLGRSFGPTTVGVADHEFSAPSLTESGRRNGKTKMDEKSPGPSSYIVERLLLRTLLHWDLFFLPSTRRWGRKQ